MPGGLFFNKPSADSRAGCSIRRGIWSRCGGLFYRRRRGNESQISGVLVRVSLRRLLHFSVTHRIQAHANLIGVEEGRRCATFYNKKAALYREAATPDRGNPSSINFPQIRRQDVQLVAVFG